MLAGWKFQCGFRLPTAEVQVVVIVDDGEVKGGQVRVHQQMMVPGIVHQYTGRRYPHVPETKAHSDRA